MALSPEIISAAAGFITSQILQSKGYKTARDEITLGLWQKIKNFFIKKDKKNLVKKLEQDPEKYSGALELAIEEFAQKYPEFEQLILEIVKQAQADPGKTNFANAVGNNNQIFQDIKGNITNQTHYGTGDNVAGDKKIYNNDKNDLE